MVQLRYETPVERVQFELTRRISPGSQFDCRRRRYRHVDCRLVGRLSITRVSPGRVNFISK